MASPDLSGGARSRVVPFRLHEKHTQSPRYTHRTWVYPIIRCSTTSCIAFRHAFRAWKKIVMAKVTAKESAGSPVYRTTHCGMESCDGDPCIFTRCCGRVPLASFSCRIGSRKRFPFIRRVPARLHVTPYVQWSEAGKRTVDMSWHEFSGHFAVSAGRGLPGRLATLFDGRICTIFGDGIPHRRGYTRQLLHVQEVAPKHARCGTPVYRIAKGIPGNCLMYKKLRQGTHAMVHR